MALVNRGLLHYMNIKKFLKKSSLKLQVRFLAHLSTTCSRGAFRVTGCPSSVMRRQQFFKHQLLLNRWANWTKHGRNVPWEVLFKNCTQNLIPSKTLVAMATKWNFLSNSLKIFSSETAGWIVK